MPGITVRLGSERMTSSSTSSSTTTITRAEAKAASFCTPRRPHIWVLPATSARCACTIATTLADDLVTRGEADEMGETLDDDGVAVMHEARDGVPHGHHLAGRHASTIRKWDDRQDDVRGMRAVVVDGVRRHQDTVVVVERLSGVGIRIEAREVAA